MSKLDELVYGAEGDFDRKLLLERLRAYLEERFGLLMQHESEVREGMCSYYCVYDEDAHGLLHGEECLSVSAALARAKEE